MRESWTKYMDLGIIHFMIYPQVIKGDGPIVETAERIASDDFFNVLEIGLVNDPEALKQLKQILEVSRLRPGGAAQPGLLVNKLNLAALDEDGRQAAVVSVKGAIDQAYYLGARITALLDGANSWPGENKAEAATAQFIRSLRELCQYAQDKATDYTMVISVENFDRDVDKRSLIGPTVEAAALAAEVRTTHANMGLTVDLSHLPLLHETPREALTAAKEYLVHSHIGNALMRDPSREGYGDQHPRMGVPGGENDVDELVEYLRVLFEIGYFEKALPTPKPVVSFEVKPLSGESSELVIANCKRVWREAWDKLKL